MTVDGDHRPDSLRRPAPSLDRRAMGRARARWSNRAKPPGALGALEDLAVHLAGVTGQSPPPVPVRPAVALFAGDHGVVADGASAWPSAITGAMVATIAAGGAAINALAATVGASVTVVDVGMAGPRPEPGGPFDGVLDRRVRSGTDSIARGPAMARAEAEAAVAAGLAVAEELIDGGADLLIGGEMGIGNTTPSAALIAAATGRPAADLIGPGAGEPAEGLDHKRGLVERALTRAGAPTDPIELLAELGGLEIGALAGCYVGAADRRCPFVVDGVIALAALVVAEGLAPGAASLAVAGHRSTEPAATAALEHLGLVPLLDLGLRLGEGTGATLAVTLLQAAARALTQMVDLPEG